MLIKDLFFKYKVWVICALACIIIPVFKPIFLSANNINGMLVSMIPYGMVAVGLMFSLVSGVINLTIGSVMSLSAVVFAMLLPSVGILPAAAAAVFAGAVVGFVDGWLVAYAKLNSWLVAISLMLSVKGIAVLIARSETIRIMDPLFSKISSSTIGPVPILFFLYIAIVLLVDFFLFKTQMGRNLFAVGGSGEVAAACGLNSNWYCVFALTVSSALTGLGGVLLTTRLYSANGNLGNDAIMSCLPMVIMGGSTFTGGKGSAMGAVSGCLVMVLITTVMNLFNIYVNVQTLIQGMILLAIVISDKYFINKNIKV